MASPSEPAPPHPFPLPGSEIAAVDLGSNSFHMAIARAVHDLPVIVDRIREPVRLGLGLDEGGRLGDAAASRALDCLGRFGQRIRHLPPSQVRAVGTHSLRRIRKARRFLERAEAALGHGIEVISGVEEARLVYLGAAQDLADDAGLRLVVDIGGGSTECVLGEAFEVLLAHSLHVGCIDVSRRHFPEGRIRKKGMDAAVLAARGEVRSIQRRFRDLGWDRAVGSSGTIRVVADVIRQQGWGDGTVTPSGLEKLRKALVAAGHVAKLDLPGLKSTRAPVFPGGVAVLSGLFEGLDVVEMEPAFGALREGLLYDLLGRIRHEDVRERTIRVFQHHYHVDLGHAARVERHALALLRQAAPGWAMEPTRAGRHLAWAARLHEVGLAIAYAHHHAHGAYLLSHAAMPGFSRDDQRLLALVVGGHRRRIRDELLDGVEEGPQRELAVRLLVLLRLAVLFHRDRGPQPIPPLEVEGRPEGLRVRPAAGWMAAHPLTRQDLEQEVKLLRRIGFELGITER